LIELINNKTAELEPMLIDIRRHLHRNPELSGREVETAEYILGRLQEAGIDSKIIETDAGPAVIGSIISDESLETIAFRADMDALPVTDKKCTSYASKNCGIMHACGHDFHVTSTLGTAFLLAGLGKQIGVNLKFIFQPGEESVNSGAKALVKTGIMQGISSIFTIHAHPSLSAGQVGITYGAATAAIDSFRINIKGIGGHSARPHEAVDSIFIASQIINCLYSDVGRKFDPFDPVVISVGKISGGTASNVITENCEMEGTVRTFQQAIREKLRLVIDERVDSIAKSYGATAEAVWSCGSDPVINDHSLAKLCEDCAGNIIKQENVIRVTKPSMGAEDFSAYLSHAPGILIRVGTGGKNKTYPLHSCMFDIDESAISVAVGLLSSIACNYASFRANLKTIEEV